MLGWHISEIFSKWQKFYVRMGSYVEGIQTTLKGRVFSILAWLREFTGAVLKASLYKAIVTAYEPESGWSIHDQDETWVKLSGGPNRLMLKNQLMSCGLTYNVNTMFDLEIYTELQLRPQNLEYQSTRYPK